MPSVMIRRTPQGQLTLYIAKRDLEIPVVSLEHDRPDCWGGKITLADDTAFYLELMPSPPHLPITLRATRAGED